jgi:flagellar biosynthesis protein FlhG
MDQAERLRQMMDLPARRTRAIAIASGKGGVGKTNIAVNLGIALARMGRRAILIDVDIGLANADVLLGVETRFNLGNVLAGEVGVLDALVPCPGGLLLLPGSTAAAVSDLSEGERSFLSSRFRQLESLADIIIIDTAAGISRNVIEFCRAADEVLVVTTPEPTAITDGYALVKAIAREKGHGRLRLIVNQAIDRGEAGRVSERLRAVSRRFLGIEVDNLGYVLADERVRSAVRRRKPFVLETPRAPAAVCVRAIAERILGEPQPVPRPEGSFLQRFAAVLGMGVRGAPRGAGLDAGRGPAEGAPRGSGLALGAAAGPVRLDMEEVR